MNVTASPRLTNLTHLTDFNRFNESLILKHPIVIAIDGTSASGKSTNARMVAKALGYVYVDTGAMYRTLAWHCLQNRVDIDDVKAVGAHIRKWKTSLDCVDGNARLLVESYYPE